MKIFVTINGHQVERDVSPEEASSLISDGHARLAANRVYQLVDPQTGTLAPHSGTSAEDMIRAGWLFNEGASRDAADQARVERDRQHYAADQGPVGAYGQAIVNSVTGGLATDMQRSLGSERQRAEVRRGSHAQVPDYGTALPEASPVASGLGTAGGYTLMGLGAALTGGALAEGALAGTALSVEATAGTTVFNSIPHLAGAAVRVGVPIAMESAMQGTSAAANNATLRHENLTGEAIVAESGMALGINLATAGALGVAGAAGRPLVRRLLTGAGGAASRDVLQIVEGRGLNSVRVADSNSGGLVGAVRRIAQASHESGRAAEQLAMSPELRAALGQSDEVVAAEANKLAGLIEHDMGSLERQSAAALRSPASREAIADLAGQVPLEGAARAAGEFLHVANNLEGIIGSLPSGNTLWPELGLGLPARLKPVGELAEAINRMAMGTPSEALTSRQLFAGLTDLQDSGVFTKAIERLNTEGYTAAATEVANIQKALTTSIENPAWGQAGAIRSRIARLATNESGAARIMRKFDELQIATPHGDATQQASGNKILNYANALGRNGGLPAQARREGLSDYLSQMREQADMHAAIGNDEMSDSIRRGISDINSAHTNLETRALARETARQAGDIAGGGLKAHVVNSVSRAVGGIIGGHVGGAPGFMAGGWIGGRAGNMMQRQLTGILMLAKKVSTFDGAYAKALLPVREAITSSGVIRPAVSSGLFTFTTIKEQQEEFRKVSAEIRGLNGNPENFVQRSGEVLGSVARANPGIGQAASNTLARGYDYLSHALGEANVNPLTGQPRNIPKYQMDDFFKKLEVVINPLAVLDSLSAGRLSSSQVECLASVYPSIYGSVVRDVGGMVMDNIGKVPYATRVQLSVLLGTALDPTTDPMFMNIVQNTYAQTSAQAGAIGMSRQQANGAGAQPSRSTRRLSVSSNTQTEADSLSNGELS